ncbi:MAG: heme NO-binding domain-containing protein [Magnetococcales bacterium]|nr:heme NO-binding domain-containing protein [Magnetococcales bacterium]
MHGIIFLAFEDFLTSRLNGEAWGQVLAKAGLANSEFSPEQVYPDEHIMALFDAGAEMMHLTRNAMLFSFGNHLAPGLVEMGRSTGIVAEHWKTMDILEHLNSEIHSSFASFHSASKVPDIRTYRLKHGEVAIAYVSKRRLCPLLKGILQGMAEVFREPVVFKEPVCMLNHGPLCRLSVTINDPLMQRYVDVQREFALVHSRIEEIKLFTQYKGIPISGSGLVLRYDHDEVLIQTQELELVAMRECGEVFMAVSHLPVGLKASVKHCDLTQGTALLTSFYLTDGAVGRRNFKRVVPDVLIPVQLTFDDKKLKGVIHNLSGGGLAVDLKHGQNIDEMMLFVPVRATFRIPLKWVKIGDTIELGPHDISMDANVLDVQPLATGQRVRILFSPSSTHNLVVIEQYFKSLQDVALAELDALLHS